MAVDKMYVLDTNVLVHDPRALFAFKGAHVGIPIIVIEELDTFKGENSGRGKSARDVVRYLDDLRQKGSLGEGVPLDNGGTLRVLFMPEEKMRCPSPLTMDVADNDILMTVLCLQEEVKEVWFISKDLSARVKADAIGINTDDYLRGKERISEENFYKGWVAVDVPAVVLKKDLPEELADLKDTYSLTVNEFVQLRARTNPHNYRVFRFLGGDKFVPVHTPAFRWPLEPRNVHQLMALNLLHDDNIKLVNLIGPAGTGKTFLALLAGLHKVLVEDVYKRMLIARPVIPLGADIGYLPGDVQEKLLNWMQPIYDNMELIAHSARTQAHVEDIKWEEGGRRGGKHKKKGRDHRDGKKSHRERRGASGLSLDGLIKAGKISLEAITYMRGRSIPFQYIFIDEVQNLSPHEVKTLITRVGEGSKIILAGDPFQIDSPYLDFSSNGLVTATNAFKGDPIFGSVFLETSERSKLSELASELM